MKKNWIYNNKASEIYYSVNFKYSSDLERDWYIPIKNRRDGTDFEDSEDEAAAEALAILLLKRVLNDTNPGPNLDSPGSDYMRTLKVL